ncbi:MAG: two-component system, OmpR family, sensor histidine kinase ResE [Candidatus Peregrinibacteria bacterium Greene0416_19]|nr:MAG: two-component system, OmpR family, sensor histidine kinase ResE [Candidatus Peregrinibacteria bacterium Greene0416_19]
MVLPRMKKSILHRIVWQSLLVSAITILLLSTLSYVIARSVTTQQRLFEQLTLATNSRVTLIEAAMERAKVETSELVGRQEAATVLRNPSLLQELWLQRSASEPTLLGITVFHADRTVAGVTGARSPVPFFDLSATQLVPFVDRKKGWQAVDVYSPIHGSVGDLTGVLAQRYDVAPVLASIFSSLGLGETEEVTLARKQGGEVFVLSHSKDGPLQFYPIGNVISPHIEGSPLALAVQGQGGVSDTRDEKGRSVVVAYRYLPSLGWGMTVKVAGSEAFAKVARLGFFLALLSLTLLALSGVFGFIFARRITAPLLHLSEKIRVLGPGHWSFERSVTTGDEVEALDHMIADLTSRLKMTYERLEKKVATTADALQKQHELDRAILESIHYGVVAVSADGIITDVNPAAVRLLGFDRPEFIGRKAAEMIQLRQKKEAFTPATHPVARCLSERAVFRATQSMHLNMVCKDQTILPAMLMVTPLLHGMDLLGAILIFQDVTEERQTDYMKSDFISLASHQLRTPLSSLLWYTEILSTEEADHVLTDEQKEYVAEIQKASQRMANLLDTLLRVARMDEGGMVIEKKEVNLVEVMQRLAEDLKDAAKDANVTSIIDLPNDPIPLSVDPVLLSIVLQNLFSNAIKYSARGSVITFSMRAVDKQAVIMVQDMGIGVPQSEQPHVFEKFFRASNIRRMTTTGTGLGLYISKRIIEDLGGTITFASKEGEGTTFTITLPR